jgi:acetyltransferase-like isoleucine patch superfamily enzyme
MFDGLNIYLFSENAFVKIGNNCDLGGLTIRCNNYVEIGNSTLTANSLIQDKLFLKPQLVKSKIYKNSLGTKINIGDNIWIGAHSCILENSRINNKCVIALGSLTYNKSFEQDLLIGGSPAVRGLPIESVMKWHKWG